MSRLQQCQAEVERIVVSEQHREARAKGWTGHLGSRQMHDRVIVRCPYRAIDHRQAYPLRGSYEDMGMQTVTIAVCGVHRRASSVRKAEDA
jgi:hypothetical protein